MSCLAVYNRYYWARRIWGRLGWLPASARLMLGRWILRQSPERWDSLAVWFGIGVKLAGDKAHKLAEGLAGASDLDDLYRCLVSEWKQPEAVLPWARVRAPTLLARPDQWPVHPGGRAPHDVSGRYDLSAGRHPVQGGPGGDGGILGDAQCPSWTTGWWSLPGGCRWR